MGSNPTESSCWALVPQVCSNLPRNREQPGAVYDSLALKGLGKDYSFLPLGTKYSACDDIQT